MLWSKSSNLKFNIIIYYHIELMNNDEVDNVIEELFQSLLSSCQISDWVGYINKR